MLPGRSPSLFCFPCGWWSFGIRIQFSNELHQRGHSRSSSVFWNFQPVIFKNQEFWKKFDSKILNWKIEKMENNFKKGNLKKFPSIVKLPGMRDRQTLWPAVDHQRDPSDISGYCIPDTVARRSLLGITKFEDVVKDKLSQLTLKNCYG